MIFALRSAGYLVLLVFFWFGLGRALGRWLTAGSANTGRHALNGFALATLAATLGYHWGLPLAWIFRGLAIVAVAGYVMAWRQKISPPPGLPKPAVVLDHDLVLLLIGGLVLLAPIAIGGLQFALFQSNQYDAFNYLEAAVLRLNYTHQEIANARPAEFLQNPLLVIAHRMATSRPAISDTYALTNGLSPGNLHLLGPVFLGSLLLLAIPAVAGFARKLGASPLRAGLIGVAVIGGFWGQYILDTDAWSQLGALPLALAVFCALDALLDPTAENRPTALGLAVPAAALQLVYPEEFCFLAPAVGFLTLLRWRQNRASGANRKLLAALVGTVVLAAPCGADVVSFVNGQLNSAAHADHTTLTWAWAALFGAAPQTAPFWLTGWQTLAGIFGIYLPWVDHPVGSGFNPGFFLCGLLGVGLVLGAFSAARRALGQPTLRNATSPLLIFAGFLTVQTLAIGLLLGAWPAAKALSYCFPWVMLLAFLPLIAPTSRPMSRWPALVLLVLQLALVCWRPLIASGKNGAGYPEPYPAADAALKVCRRWDTDEAPRLLANAHRVRIDVPDLWLEYYAMICLQAQGLPFVKTTPVREYYDMTPKIFGSQDLTADTDGLVFGEFDRHANTFALGFALGQELRWSNRRPFTITRLSGPPQLESWQGLLSWWNDAVLEVQADAAGTGALELLMRRHPTLPDSARPAVTIAVNGQPVQTLVIGPIQTGALQGNVISLNLQAGRNLVTIHTDSPGGAPAIGFSNPHFMLPASAAGALSP